MLVAFVTTKQMVDWSLPKHLQITELSYSITLIKHLMPNKTTYINMLPFNHCGKNDLFEKDVAFQERVGTHGIVHAIGFQEMECLLTVTMYEINVIAPENTHVERSKGFFF